MKKFVVFGASGMVGQEVIKELSNNDYEYKAVLRSKSSDIKDGNQLIYPDILQVPKEELKDANVICCLGSSINNVKNAEEFIQIAVYLVVELAKLCKQRDCKNFTVISGMGGDKNSKMLYVKAKGLLEEELKKVDLKCLNIVRPFMLLGDRKENRPIEKTMLTILKPFQMFFRGYLLKYKLMPATKLAKYMIFMSVNKDSGVNIIDNDLIHKTIN